MTPIEILIKAKEDSDKAFNALYEHLKKSQQEAEKTSKSFSGLSGLAFQFNQMTGAMSTLARWAGAVATEFVQLAERGGQVAAVSGSFDKLAKSVGETGAALLGSVRAGTKGLVSDFDIMLNVNKAVLLGLPVTSKEMGVLSNAALVLGKTMGLSTNQALGDLITGLGRGSAAILDNLGITIKAEDAYKRYAASIGKQATELTAAEQKIAIYKAAVDGAAASVATIGDVQLTFSDRMTQVNIGVENFKDSLGKAIAQSPVLNAALGTIASAMEQAFGKNQEQTIKGLIGIVNDMAIGLVSVGKVGIEIATFLNNMFNGLKAVFSAFVLGMVDMAMKAAAALGADKLADHLALVRAQMIDYTKSVVDTIAANNQAKDAAISFLDNLQATMEAARGATVKLATGSDGIPGVKKAAEDADKGVTISAEKREALLRTVLLNEKKHWADWQKEKLGEALRISDALIKLQEDERKAFIEDLMARKERLQEFGDAMAQAVQDLRARAFDGLADGLGQAVEILDALGISAESGLGKIVNLTSQTANMIAAAAERGYFTISDLVNQAAQIFKSGSVLGGAASGAMTGFAVGGPIGAGIGALAGGLLGLFGKAKQAREEMEKLKNSFISSQGGIQGLIQKAKEAGVSLDAMFKAKSAQQLQQAIAGIKSGLDTWTEAQEELHAAMEKYGISVSEMGPKFAQQELDKKAAQIWKEFEILRRAGGDVVVLMEKMGPEMVKYVQEAIKAGATVPEEMRKIVEQLIAEGKILDENGNAYKSAEDAGISFAKSQSQLFQEVAATLERIGAALERLAGIRPPPIHVPVVADYEDGFPGAPGRPRGAPGGGLPEFHQGGFTGNGSRPFAAMLNPQEFVNTAPQMQQLLQQAASMGAAMAMAMTPHGGGGGGPVLLGREQVGRVVSDMAEAGQLRIPAHAIRGGRGSLRAKA